jgi:FK506-binding nuclear protein
MSFFGRKVTNEKTEVEVPRGFSLTLLMAVVEKGRGSLVVETRSSGSESFLLCDLSAGTTSNCPIQAEFGHGDSPVILSNAHASTIHVTGRFGLAGGDEEEAFSMGDSDEEEEEEEEAGEEEAVADEKEKEKKGKTKEEEKKKKKRKVSDEPANATSTKDATSNKLSRTEAKKARAQAREEDADTLEKLEKWFNVGAGSEAEVDAKLGLAGLGKWKVKPIDEEGVLVPELRRVRRDGILFTDYIVGRGRVPKPGALIKVTYEGLYPGSGAVFDRNLKRSKPLAFRKGAGQVVRGMDLGVEGMRIGGSREIVIPAHLG